MGKRFVAIFLCLIIGTTFLSGCNKEEEEDSLGASRPIYNPMFDISIRGLDTTEWSGDMAGKTIVLNFNQSHCTVGLTDNKTGEKTTMQYAYTYEHPTVTLKPEGEGEVEVKGTTKSSSLVADCMTFVDAHGSPVWTKVIRKK